MPSKSKQQQKFFGIVRSIQKGDAPASKFSKQAKKAAKDMEKDDVKSYAATKHKGLPKKVNRESLESLENGIRNMVKEFMTEGHHDKREGKMAKYDAKEIAQDAADVFKMIDKNMDLPEWLEAKITIAAHNMNTVKDYLTHHQPKNEVKLTESSDTFVNILNKFGFKKGARDWGGHQFFVHKSKNLYATYNANGRSLVIEPKRGGKALFDSDRSNFSIRALLSYLQSPKNKFVSTEGKLKVDEIGFTPNPDIGQNYYVAPKRDTKGGMKSFYQKYSSPEAKSIIDGALKQWAKELRKVQFKVIKDWMTAAKANKIDFFDLVRGLNTGDVSRAKPFEVKFLSDLLTQDKIVDRFRSYFKGKKGKKRN